MERTNNTDSNIPQRKLSIQVSLNGLSFCSYHEDTLEVIDFEQINISAKASSYDWEEKLNHFFQKNPMWKTDVHTVTVFHQCPYFTWVPTPLFLPENAGSYLQFSSKIFDTDLFAHDALACINVTFVYVPLTHINNVLLDFYPSFEFYHASFHWLKKVQSIKEHRGLHVCMLVESQYIEIAVFDQDQMLLHNQFEVKNAVDILYYTLFCFEQLHLHTEQTPVFVMGKIEKDDATWQLLYEYIREVRMHSLQNRHNQKQIPFSLTL